jgi:hypothetical protein
MVASFNILVSMGKAAKEKAPRERDIEEFSGEDGCD